MKTFVLIMLAYLAFLALDCLYEIDCANKGRSLPIHQPNAGVALFKLTCMVGLIVCGCVALLNAG